jgi:transcriptional regulator with XRE-family HTH domain
MPQKPKYSLPEQNSVIKAIGKNIATTRKKRGLTQKEFAQQIGITQTLLSHYETGRLRITGDMIAVVAKTLKVSADTIIGLKKDENHSNEISLKLIRRVKRLEGLSINMQKKILSSIDMMIDAALNKKYK